MPLGCAKFHVNRCNESPLWAENADFKLLTGQKSAFSPLQGENADFATTIRPVGGKVYAHHWQFAASRRPAGNQNLGAIFNYLEIISTS